jgi:Holliday junction resolvase RusA-like endonuclease
MPSTPRARTPMRDRSAWERVLRQRDGGPARVRTPRRDPLKELARLEAQDQEIPWIQSIDIDPVPAPRQTQRDRWTMRRPVARYRAYADALGAAGIRLPTAFVVSFHIAMPTSWPESLKAAMEGKPHLRKPDKDNLLKALQDALMESDACIHSSAQTKRWARAGRVVIRKLPWGGLCDDLVSMEQTNDW